MQTQPSTPEVEEIGLRVCLLDLEADLDSEQVPVEAERPRRAIPDSLAGLDAEDGAWCSLRAEDDEYDLIVSAAVLWIGPNQVSMVAPACLSPFGPCGPTLDLGDVLEVVPLEDGTFGYVRLLKRGRIWSRTLPDPGRQALEDTSTQMILDQLLASGCTWEWFVGNLMIQAPLEEGEREPAGPILELVEVLAQVLEEAKVGAGFGYGQH